MTLQFWMGAALASIVCWIFLWWFLSIGNKQANRNDDKNGAANDLLAERNEIGRQQVEALSKVVAKLDALVETIQLQAPEIPEEDGIKCIVRRGDPKFESYRSARFNNGVESTFMWNGHRWRYDHSSFDDQGEFDVLWRPITPATQTERREA